MREIITTYSGLYIAHNTFGYAAYQHIKDIASNTPVTRYRASATDVMKEIDELMDSKNWEGGE